MAMLPSRGPGGVMCVNYSRVRPTASRYYYFIHDHSDQRLGWPVDLSTAHKIVFNSILHGNLTQCL